MMAQAQWHPAITFNRVAEAVKNEMFCLENPGFCLACGAEAEGCEPDARNYVCENCGAAEVYGAQEILIGMTPPRRRT
jgi:predicted amidophosphoribosyltransferase